MAPESGRGTPLRVQSAVGHGSVVTSTERTTGALSAWMNENPKHGSGATANEVVIIGATTREGEREMGS